MSLRPRRASIAAAAILGTLTALALAAPASAHVEVSADNPQAGARNVTVTFNGEAESTTAGIASEQVVLPAGIKAQDVRLAKAPTGWTLTPTADGFTVAGPALPVGEDAVFSIVIAQLPTGATELVFKTLETYGDGKIDRWIELPQAGQPEPENPAPILKLSPADPAATTAAPTTTPATAATTTVTASNAAADTGGSGTGLWVAILVVVLLAIGAGILFWRRRRPTNT